MQSKNTSILVEKILKQIIIENPEFYAIISEEEINTDNALKIIMTIINKRGGKDYILKVLKKVR